MSSRVSPQETIPFDEIVAGASARLAVIEKIQYLCARDVIMFIAGKDNKQASQIWSRLSPEQLEELSSFRRNFKFPGQGQGEQPVLTFKGILKLVMWIGGQNAKKYRSAMVSILERYYAGDGSLMDEVEANAQSAGPIQQMARASLAVPVLEEEALDLPFKKRRMELAMAREEMELAERRLTHAAKVLQHTGNAIETIDSLKNKANIDERTKMQIEDYIKNTLFNTMSVPSPSLLAITADAAPAVNATAPINVSIVAKELGVKLTDAQLQRVGREMAKKYREVYQSDPPKHKQFVNGNYIPVNSYMERDRPMMEQVIRAVGCE